MHGLMVFAVAVGLFFAVPLFTLLFSRLGVVEEATAQEIERVYATNVFGLLALTRAVLPDMRHQRSGHVLNTSAIKGYAASAGWGVYCSTKFAVEGLTGALAVELKPPGIRATVIEPGFFRTDFLDARSLSVSTSQINDYADTAGAMRNFAATANHAQPGNPAKLTAALMILETPLICHCACHLAAIRCSASKQRMLLWPRSWLDGATLPSRPMPQAMRAAKALCMRRLPCRMEDNHGGPK